MIIRTAKIAREEASMSTDQVSTDQVPADQSARRSSVCQSCLWDLDERGVAYGHVEPSGGQQRL